jgi:hypothetical protein
MQLQLYISDKEQNDVLVDDENYVLYPPNFRIDNYDDFKRKIIFNNCRLFGTGTLLYVHNNLKITTTVKIINNILSKDCMYVILDIQKEVSCFFI